MDDILVESDIKTLKILSKTEGKCSIKNPISTYDHASNAYTYPNSSTLSKQKVHKKEIYSIMIYDIRYRSYIFRFFFLK